MIRGVCLAICLVAFLLGDATVARADVSRGERRTTTDSPRLLTRAIEDHRLLLPPLTRAKFRRPVGCPAGLMSTQLQSADRESKE